MCTSKLIERVKYAASVFISYISISANAALACPDIDGLTDRNCDKKLVVVGFGDSITFGIGDGLKLGYLGWLKSIHPNITTVNLGVPGEATSAGKVRAAKTIPYIPEADYTVILEGTNDFFQTKKSFVGTKDNLARIRSISINSGGQTFLSTLTPTTRKSGQGTWIQGLNRTIVGITNLDFYSLGQTIIGHDRIHPNTLGYQSMATYLSNALVRTSRINKPADSDRDGVFDFAEIRYGTSPNNPDSDGDGISDGSEIFTYGSNPLSLDSDGDGFSDNQEVFTLLSNPADPAPSAPTITSFRILK